MLRSILAFGLALAAASLLGQSYQSSFAEVKYGRARTPATFHGGAEVDLPTGAVSFGVPLGPGIGARGLKYVPTLSTRFAPQVAPYDPYAGSNQVLPGGISCALTPGYLVVSAGAPKHGAGGVIESEYLLPDGSSGSGLSLQASGNPPYGINPDAILSAFGLFGNTASYRGIGQRGELFLGLSGDSYATRKVYLWQPTIRYPNPPRGSSTAETMEVPGGIVVVSPDGATATVFALCNAEFQRAFAGSSWPVTGLLAPQAALIDDQNPNDLRAVHYLPTLVLNRFGEQIVFNHFPGTSKFGLDFDATWSARGGGSARVSVRASVIGGGAVPGINGGGAPQTGARFTVSYSQSKVSSYTVQAYGYFDWAPVSPNTWGTAMNSAWDRYRRNLQPSQVTVDATGEFVKFLYQAAQSEPGGGYVPVTLQRLEFPYRTTTFLWKTYPYRRPPGGNVFSIYGVLGSAYTDIYRAAGVIQVDDQDTTSGGQTRTTTYTRTVPVPTSAPNGPYWHTTAFSVGVRHPDGRGTLTRYAEPLPNVIFDASTWTNASKVMQALAYLKHIPVEIREYEKGVSFDGDTQSGGGGSAYRVVLNGPPAGQGRFDVSGFDNAYWSLKQVGNPDGTQGTTPYPIRVETWTPENHRIENRSSWDSTNYGWRTQEVWAGGCAGSKTMTSTFTYTSAPGTWSMGLVSSESHPDSPKLDRSYNSDNTLRQVVLNSGGSPSVTTDFSYQGLPTPKTVTLSGSGLVLSGQAGARYEFDTFGYVNSITPAASGISWGYGQDQDSLGRPTRQTDPFGVATSYDYNGAGRLSSITPPAPESSTTVGYDGDNLGVSISRGSQFTHLRYNGFGELVSETRATPNGQKTRTFSYDLAGRRTFESVWGSSAGTTSAYDGQGRLEKVTDPNGMETRTTYNGCSRTVSVGGAGGPQTTFTKDSFGRLVGVTDALGQSTTYTYDNAGRLTALTQGSQSRTWDYNPMGWLMSLTQPETGTTGYSGFTVTGKPTVTTYAGNRIVDMNPDPLGRPTSVSARDGSATQSFSYDRHRLNYSLDQKVRLNYSYGGLNGRLSALTTHVWNTGPASATGNADFSAGQTFEYNPDGFRKRATVDGRAHDFTAMDTLGLPKTVSYTGAGLNNVQLGNISAVNDSGSPTAISFANGAATSASYRPDGVGLQTLGHTTPAGPRGGWTFTIPTNGRLAGQITSDGEDSYDYDLLGRLVSASVKVPNSAVVVSQTYEYDAFGNPLASTTNNLASLPAGLQKNFTSFRFSAADLAGNRIPARTVANGGIPAGDTGVAYDPQGNLSYLFKEVNATSRWVSLQYDALGRVTQLVDNERNVTEKYFYTPEGLRTRIETWQGIPPQSLVLQKVEHRIYNDQRQLVSQYEAVAP